MAVHGWSQDISSHAFDLVLLGWGLLSRFPPFRYFSNFSTSPKYMLAIEYHVHIWQVLPQLSCGDTCQIWMWFKYFKRYFCEIKNFAYGEIDERSFSNPQPWSVNSSPPGWNGCHFTDDIFRCIFVNEKFCILIKFHWILFLRVQLTLRQHWFRWWLRAE